ncbi:MULTISPECIES: Tfp pilus assembly protein FimT/FimU [unclassified Variovorax]|uniref:GspH/FimT family pseudopilin n=1 Tax=unclassified Variovorax TaxID=663243 RepID=UPI0025754693|nr:MULTISPECIES: Tfp pilus assembly protein FimT/FimU [unclassified Variovorax]MDM0091011.1 Tfp pilus assembly protein FimT/FimU [Variovorax sp. J22G40]MDM0148987.1 Tfp pilus assembly protein FimT/FimU [Variovorax sp. J2P1-31]
MPPLDRRPAPGAVTGFTAIELMVVLAIVAILMVVAVPSFSLLIQRNRLATQTNAFIGDLQFTRAEAIKQGLPVTICASSDGSTCLGTTTWGTGWIVFADPDNSKTRDATKVAEALLRRQAPWPGSDTFTASNSIAAITYSRDGFALGLTGTITLAMRTNPANAQTTRCVTLSLVGRPQVVSPNGSNCT